MKIPRYLKEYWDHRNLNFFSRRDSKLEGQLTGNIEHLLVLM